MPDVFVAIEKAVNAPARKSSHFPVDKREIDIGLYPVMQDDHQIPQVVTLERDWHLQSDETKMMRILLFRALYILTFPMASFGREHRPHQASAQLVLDRHSIDINQKESLMDEGKTGERSETPDRRPVRTGSRDDLASPKAAALG